VIGGADWGGRPFGCGAGSQNNLTSRWPSGAEHGITTFGRENGCKSCFFNMKTRCVRCSAIGREFLPGKINRKVLAKVDLDGSNIQHQVVFAVVVGGEVVKRRGDFVSWVGDWGWLRFGHGINC
jgi:hypothetical protein